jgi:hypothetical protein
VDRAQFAPASFEFGGHQIPQEIEGEGSDRKVVEGVEHVRRVRCACKPPCGENARAARVLVVAGMATFAALFVEILVYLLLKNQAWSLPLPMYMEQSVCRGPGPAGFPGGAMRWRGLRLRCGRSNKRFLTLRDPVGFIIRHHVLRSSGASWRLSCRQARRTRK